MLKDVVITETLIPEGTLGSLTVWCAVSIEQRDQGLRPTHYFWRDAGSPQGFGPFPRLYDTMVHYANTVKLMQNSGNSQTGMGQVIQVDFINKRKV